MSIDGFHDQDKDAFVSFSRDTADRFYDALDWVGRRLHVEMVGLENVPPGRALLVANHAFAWDIAFAMGAIMRATGRPVWALGEHAWWRVPFVRRLASSVGTVDGTAANCDRLLAADALVLVLPGGLREAVKPRELRYRLLWGGRFGFVRAAIKAGAPIVPIAAIGGDDIWDFRGDAYARGRRWLKRDIPIPLPARILPIPHRVHLKYVIGRPIVPRALPADADDPQVLRDVRLLVEGSLHELIDVELLRRLSREKN